MKYHNFRKVGDLGNFDFFKNHYLDTDITLIRIDADSILKWYGVDEDDDTVLVKTLDGGATAWTTVSSRTNTIIAIFYDRVGEFLYCIEGDITATTYFLASGSFQVFKVDLSDDTVSNVGTTFGATGDLYNDIFYMNGVCYVAWADFSAKTYYIRDVLAGTNDTVATDTTDPLSGLQGIVYNDLVYFCGTNFLGAGESKIYSFDGTTVTSRFDLDANGGRYWFDGMLNRTRHFIENGLIYFSLEGQNLHEFWQYDPATYTMYGPEYQMPEYYQTSYAAIPISQRVRSDTTLPPKLRFQKSDKTGLPEARIWDDTNIEYDYFADIVLADDILWSDDKYVISNQYEIYEYLENTTDIFDVVINRAAGGPSSAKISTKIIFNADQKIVLKDDYGEILFQGNATKKTYSGNLREYQVVCLDKEVYNNKFTATFSAKTIKEIMESIITNYANWLSYESNSIDTAFTSTYSFGFNNVSIAEAFNFLMDYEDGLWYINPEGVVYAKKIANIPHGYTSGTFAGAYSFTDEPDYEEGTDIDWVDTDASTGASKVQIRPSLDKHLKILDCLHASDGVVSVYDGFSQDYGTIEFYFRLGQSDMKTEITIGTAGTVICAFGTGQDAGNEEDFCYYDSTGWHNIGVECVRDTWYHIRLDVEQTTGSWQSLAQYRFQVKINGTNYGAYITASTNILTRMTIASSSATTEWFHFYIDAIDYSWASGWVAGRNQEDWIDITESTDNVASEVKLTEILSEFNKITIYGAILGAARLKGSANNTTHQDNNGIIEYVDHFPHANNQTDLNTLATALLNRSGIADNPKYIQVSFKNLPYLQAGTQIEFRFNLYDELDTILSYYILKSTYNPLSEIGTYILSTGLIQEGREYSVDIHKTSDADEEQIDIIAANYIGSDAPTLGGPLSLNENHIEVDGSLTSDGDFEGLITEYTISGTPSFGDAMYLSAANTVAQADATDITKMPCVGLYVAAGKILKNGTIKDTGWSWTVNGLIYVSETTGALTQTPPSTSGAYVQIIGVASATNEIDVNPQLVMIKRG